MDSNDVLDEWEDRSGEYSPTYYAYYGPDEMSEAIRERIAEVVGSDPAILELGCSSGRHLSHLYDHGYENLHGIEVNPDAFDVMAENYPELADAGTFYADAIENVVPDFEDDKFDVVFSVETLQHIHPDNDWVFSDVTRIASELLVTVENEGPEENGEADQQTDGAQSDDVAVNHVRGDFPLYYRDWKEVFTERGFTEIDSESGKRDRLRAFRPA
ncbi:class I SAM-dependent methyltransferase [Halorussus halophilus]|uniref:class I SAM-dependent methyltransferase n=1 Tax=Halorussus halophilus TaxID=2650975 RepID=UPI0017887748|nr:class I SAM-dependent methyltransferase [Halorussus halophilus]